MPTTKKTFEQAIARLEEISSLLESENTPLSDALALYEESIKLIRFCNDTLNTAKQKITVINESSAENG